MPTPWIRNLRLVAADAVFDGREACLMRQLLGIEAPADGEPPQPSSLAEQASLAARLHHSGRLTEGLERAASLGLADFGVAGLAVLHASGLAEIEKALRILAPLLNLRHHVTIARSEKGPMFVLRPLVPDGGVDAPLLEMLDAAKLRRFVDDLLAWHGLGQRSVCQQPEPAGTALHLPRELDGPLPRSNLNEFRRCLKAARNQMLDIEHRHLATTVRRILIAGSGTGERLPDLPEVARELGYSQRTFRRRLRERGTSFMDCVNDVRHQLALRYLSTTNYTVEVIAERLGYSDTSNFRHAFRRWTGVSPRAYAARAPADFPPSLMRTVRGDAGYASAAR